MGGCVYPCCNCYRMMTFGFCVKRFRLIRATLIFKWALSNGNICADLEPVSFSARAREKRGGSRSK